MITFSTNTAGRIEKIVHLFDSTFSDSEGPDAGAAIGALVQDIFARTPAEDLVTILALDGSQLSGAICFTRLAYDDEPRNVFLLSPVAVATTSQGTGVGQALLTHGLGQMRARGVDVVLTYGNPDYYGKVGFRPITEREAQAPLPLSQPEGWLGQSLTETLLTPLAGPSRCVAAFDQPDLW
ncbi:GNAT family N-acetyltransferase [Nioella nitratireducens]|uniref:GNAT family N-acetyltransferase n=1 Tax=Nioella nitratireducens TaxID=1287720 RepID=UPI000A045DE5|nr:N-acetyltransferase [Nioella nitratireducens]